MGHGPRLRRPGAHDGVRCRIEAAHAGAGSAVGARDRARSGAPAAPTVAAGARCTTLGPGSCAAGVGRVMTVARARADWAALGTTATVLVTDPGSLEAIERKVRVDLDAVDLACSRFRADSELSRLNERPGRPVPVSPLLFEAITVALRAAELTGGVVDPTVGLALRRSGHDRVFGVPGGAVAPPVRVERATWRDVAMDADRGRVTIPAGVELDLGATAKALAADRAATVAAAAAEGVGVLVSLGGDLRIAGPSAGDWHVRICDDHRAGAEVPGQTVGVRSGGVATSSTTVRRWGRGAHHIIDPASGRPAVAPWRTVSVAASTCVDANIASTAAIVLGDAAAAWLRARGMPARMVAGDGEVLRLCEWPATGAQSR